MRGLRGGGEEKIRGENRGFARSMASEAMGDILYGEHDSIKHSIKSSLINLTLALGGGRRRDPRGVPPSFIPLRIVDHRRDIRAEPEGVGGGGETHT